VTICFRSKESETCCRPARSISSCLN